jgi:hypothetical protein
MVGLVCVILSNFSAKLNAGYTVFPPEWTKGDSTKKRECYCSTQILQVRQLKKAEKSTSSSAFLRENEPSDDASAAICRYRFLDHCYKDGVGFPTPFLNYLDFSSKKRSAKFRAT